MCDRQWDKVADAPYEQVEQAVRCSGLSKYKTELIQSLLREIRTDHGHISLEHLVGQPAAEVKRVLGKYKGVGEKTIACVLMFHLNQPGKERKRGWVGKAPM
jgi:endonuclease III